MNRGLLKLGAISLATFLCLKAFSFFSSKLWVDETGVIHLNMTVFAVSAAILLAIGLVIGHICSKTNSHLGDTELKAVGGGVIGLSFLSGLCVGGFCIPAAALSTIFSIPALIPTLLGVRIASVLPNRKQRDETEDSTTAI